MLDVLPFPSTSTLIVESDLLILSANSYFAKTISTDKPKLLLLPGMNVNESKTLAQFQGKRNILFQMVNRLAFIGLDNKLMISDDLKSWRTVLITENKENIFWHLVEAGTHTLFVQEYGHQLSGIYRSDNDGETWEKIVTCKTLDTKARHFHSLSYDRYRGILIATLGDGNLVKIASSSDFGENWKSIYCSAYQCLPIVVSKEYVVFGMDSAISNGLLVWFPRTNKWKPIHLKYIQKRHTVAENLQCSDLKRLENGVWIMSTGGGSILVSRDMTNWHCCLAGSNSFFDAHMISNESNGICTIAMGERTILANLKEMSNTFTPDLKQYSAFPSKLKGLVYVLKRLPARLK